MHDSEENRRPNKGCRRLLSQQLERTHAPISAWINRLGQEARKTENSPNSIRFTNEPKQENALV
jgi:hypothetical protein